jgi:hypothetical protein
MTEREKAELKLSARRLMGIPDGVRDPEAEAAIEGAVEAGCRTSRSITRVALCSLGVK